MTSLLYGYDPVPGKTRLILRSESFSYRDNPSTKPPPILDPVRFIVKHLTSIQIIMCAIHSALTSWPIVFRCLPSHFTVFGERQASSYCKASYITIHHRLDTRRVLRETTCSNMRLNTSSATNSWVMTV